ncbi:hypothetical protein PPYR_00657 [Photinus pyralis]|uniref:Spatacsin C-terminal domain-containing protein n=1 Tax=Photinus pyralis TaxID=7054 RepID=A0A5N4B263_PHOPY|nr:spatacsin [Photinus pyralis]KAB0803687.1 hypothetical protein PPYR_00657 [Photinus pyralis]
MAKRENIFQIKPPPPPNLNKELLGVWNAWCRMGDREVVREAAVKGHHIEFAQNFLAARNELDNDTIQQWFKDEVFVWILELLKRQQIFKASHLFTNINLDPIEEFTKIFLETCNPTLRDYLGNHLSKSERLSSTDMDTWKLLQIVMDKQEFLLDFPYNVSELNINYFNGQAYDWKCKIGTQLFFKSFDDNIKPFVTAKHAWEFLLKDCNLEILKLWINVYFSQSTEFHCNVVPAEKYECVSSMMLSFTISEEMVDCMFQGNVSEELRDGVLNELSKFGLFSSEERKSITAIIRRLNHAETLDSIYAILNCEQSTVTLTNFHSLLLDYCIKNELFLLVNWCNVDLRLVSNVSSKYLDLLSYLKNCDYFTSETGVGQLILKVANFLSDDLAEYFKENPLIMLGVIFFLLPEFNFLNLLSCIDRYGLTPSIVESSLQKLPMLHTVLTKSPVSVANLYQLLNKHTTVSTDIYKFRLENAPPPSFNSPSLQLYAYKKKTNYIFFIKLGRPSFASKFYLANSNRSLNKLGINRKILKVYFNDITNTELAVSCIAFLEMIGENSSSLRIYVQVAKLLLDSRQFSPNHIQKLFMGIFQNPERVLDVLESILMLSCSLSANSSNAELAEEIKKHEIVVKLAELHSFKLPELFLKYCARGDFWFPFLIFIQTYNYPLAQVQKLFQEFRSVFLAQHLYHGLSNEIQIDSQKELLMRDSRNFYLSRIGVRKNVDASSDSMYSSASSYGSTGSSSTSSDLFDGETLDFESDILHILIRCHNSVDPPKALLQTCFVYKCPIFAVLATSYEPDSFLTHWLMWLTVSCGLDGEISNFEMATNDANIVSALLTSTVKMGYCRVLHDSFQIFLPDNPLCVFVEFLCDCIDLNFDVPNQEKKLNRFFSEVKKRKISAPFAQVDYEMVYLSNKMWIETTALNLLAATLQYNFTSQFHQLTCMKFLHDVGVGKYFGADVPDFSKYYQILNWIIDSSYDIKLDLCSTFQSEEIHEELLAVVSKLVATRSYRHASQIAQLQKICTDFIVIDEWCYRFKERCDNKQFWEDCNAAFHDHHLDENAAVKFFEQCCEDTSNMAEKYVILDLAHDWASMRNLANVYDLETKMWIAYFQMEGKGECKVRNLPRNLMLYTEMKQILSVLENDGVPDLNESGISRLNSTIETFLNLGDFWQAFRLTKIFNYKHSDVDIIELSCNLVEGLIMPYQLSAEQRLLLVKHTNVRTLGHRRRRALMSSKGLSSFSSASLSPMASSIATMVDHVDVPFHDTLVILETLQERLQSGNKIIQSILETYRIAINIEKSYQEVFKCSDSVSLLKEALKEDCPNKLEVVHDVMSLFRWTSDKVADFISEQLIDAITEHIKLNSDTVILWNLTLDTDFSVILQLLIENCSALGLKLYSYASALHRSELKPLDYLELNVIIELLIRAHDCFTADCNMEGISIILRKCQTIILLSLQLKNWKCIVRLLTGVARYTEMNYVFHILRENDQFEFLLRKGNNKDNSLKVALLRYLKKYCPEDRELYRMVALHFTLFSEIAQLWQEEARSITRNLIAISKLEMQNNGINIEAVPFVLLTNTDGTKICLNKAMVNYTHAAEYHLQGEKLTKAMQAAKVAELLALQMSMLKGLPANSTAICILNIGDDQILNLISTELSFDQSLILIDSNNYKPDWSSVIFEQYIMRNNIAYLDSFLLSFPLSDALLHDISRKFLALTKPNGSAIRNMREMINRCSSVRVKYRIASELGFTDLVEELLFSNQLAYLKDTVWKKGYRS